MAARPSVDILSAKDFKGERLPRDGDWAVCFGAEWCPYCHTFRRYLFEKLEGKVPFSIAYADVTDQEGPLWTTFSLDVIPVVIAFRDGKVLWRRDSPEGVGLGAADVKALKEAFR